MTTLTRIAPLLIWFAPAVAGADPAVCASVVDAVLKAEGLGESLTAPSEGTTVRQSQGRWRGTRIHSVEHAKRRIEAVVFERDQAGLSSIIVAHDREVIKRPGKDGTVDYRAVATKQVHLMLDKACRVVRISSPDLRNNWAMDEQKTLLMPSFFCRELLAGAPLVTKGSTLGLEKIREGHVAVGRDEEARAICREYAAFLSPEPEPPEPERKAVVPPATPANANQDAAQPVDLDDILEEIANPER